MVALTPQNKHISSRLMITSLSFTVREREPELRDEERDRAPSEEETEGARVRDDALSREEDRALGCEARTPLPGDVAFGMRGRRNGVLRCGTT